MTTRLLSLQLLLAFAVANARNDPPPTSDRAWSPPDLPNYERDLAEQRFKTRAGQSLESLHRLYDRAAQTKRMTFPENQAD